MIWLRDHLSRGYDCGLLGVWNFHGILSHSPALHLWICSKDTPDPGRLGLLLLRFASFDFIPMVVLWRWWWKLYNLLCMFNDSHLERELIFLWDQKDRRWFVGHPANNPIGEEHRRANTRQQQWLYCKVHTNLGTRFFTNHRIGQSLATVSHSENFQYAGWWLMVPLELLQRSNDKWRRCLRPISCRWPSLQFRRAKHGKS